MEEFGLGSFFPGNELDVIDQEDIHPSKFISKLIHLLIAERIDQLIRELFRGDVTNLPHLWKDVMLQNMISDGVKKVGLSQSHPTINKEGIVILGR